MEKVPLPDDEELFAQAFISPLKRLRVRGLLKSNRGRAKFLSELPHFSDLDPRYATKIDPSQQRLELILSLLRDKGAGAACYAVSCWSELDQLSGPLEQMLEAADRYTGTILLCLPGRLGYYVGESVNERYILQR